jgi:hypothetical protein
MISQEIHVSEACDVSNVPQICSQFEISTQTPLASTATDLARGAGTEGLLREILEVQKRSCELLVQLVGVVSQQQRQRQVELKAWREAHPDLAAACRSAAEALAKVHAEFLGSVAREGAESAEDLLESDYALGEFIDRHGPRLAHFNGLMQVLGQLAAAPPAELEPRT